MHQNQRTTVTRMYWDTIGGEKCEINLDPHLSLRPRHSYLDSDTPRLLAYPYLRQMSGSFYGYHAFIYIMNRCASNGSRHFVPVPRQLGPLFVSLFSLLVHFFFIFLYLYILAGPRAQHGFGFYAIFTDVRVWILRHIH